MALVLVSYQCGDGTAGAGGWGASDWATGGAAAVGAVAVGSIACEEDLTRGLKWVLAIMEMGEGWGRWGRSCRKGG